MIDTEIEALLAELEGWGYTQAERRYLRKHLRQVSLQDARDALDELLDKQEARRKIAPASIIRVALRLGEQRKVSANEQDVKYASPEDVHAVCELTKAITVSNPRKKLEAMARFEKSAVFQRMSPGERKQWTEFKEAIERQVEQVEPQKKEMAPSAPDDDDDAIPF